MVRISREQFIQRYLGDDLNIRQTQHTEDGRSLTQAGMSAEQLRQADLNGDGRIEGQREIGALYQQVDRYDTNGRAQSIDLANRLGVPTRAGQMVGALDRMFAANNRPHQGVGILSPVGSRQLNRRDDVLAVQERLNELGFDLEADGVFGNQTRNALQVYEGMIRGEDDASDLPGILKPGTRLDQVLGSDDAPRWTEMPDEGPGFDNVDWDGFSHGSQRLADVIRDVGQSYNDDYLAANPNASVMELNDASLRNGGDNHDHATHEAGLDLDVRLPRTDGASGTTVGSSDYDREAAYAMVSAFASDARVERILVGDDMLRQRVQDNEEPWADKVQDGGSSHNNHIHVDISPPRTVVG